MVEAIKSLDKGESDPEAVAIAENTQASLVTFIPRLSFDGYPDGLNIVHFIEGETSIPVTRDYLELLKSKNLVAD